MAGWRVLIRLGQAVFWLVSGLLLLVVFGLIWLGTTTQGARFALAQAEARVAGLSVGTVTGSLLGGLTLNDLAYQAPEGVALRLGSLHWRLDRAALGRARIKVETLALTDLKLRLPATAPSTAESAAPLNLADLPLALPLPVRIDRLALKDARLEDATGQPLLTVSEFVFRAAADARQIQVTVEPGSQLHLPEENLQVHAAGTMALAVAAPHAVSGQLAWRLDAPAGWLPGEVRLGGTLDTLSAQLDAALLGNWLPGLPPVSFTAELTAVPASERFDLSALRVDGLGGCLRGSGTFDGARQSARGQLAWQDLDPGLLAPDAAGRLTGRMTGHWQAATGAEIQVAGLTGQIAGVALKDLAFTGTWQAPMAALTLTGGQVAGGAVTAEARYGVSADRPVALKLDWAPTDSLPLPGTPAQARGRLRIQAQGHLGADPATSAEVSFAASLQDGSISAQATRVPVGLSLHGAWQRGVLQLDEGRAQIAGMQMQAEGLVGLATAEPVANTLRASLTAQRLAQLPTTALGLPPVGGALQAQLALQGTPQRPTGSLNLTGHGLSWGDWRLGSVQLAARVDAAQQGTLTLTAARLTQQGRAFLSTATVSANGAVPGLTDGAQRLSARIDAAPGSLRLAAEGRWEQTSWQGQLTALTLSALRWERHVLPDWHLARPVPIRVSAESQRLGELCLTSRDAARFCVAGDYASAQGGHGQATLSGNLPLSLAQPWLPADLRLPGRLEFEGNANLRAGVPTAAWALTLPASHFTWPSVFGAETLDYTPVTLRGRWQPDALNARIDTDTPDLLSLHAQGQWGMTDRSPLSGTLALTLPRLDRARFLVPMLAGLKGQAALNLALAGTAAAPRIQGAATVSDLAFALPDTGVSYRAGALAAKIEPTGALQLTGALTAVAPKISGAGETQAPLHLVGSGQWASPQDWHLRTTLDGEQVPLLRLPTLSVDASPALTLDADAAGATVGGQIDLPVVDARVAALPAGVVSPTEDLVIEGEQPPAPKPPGYPVQGRVRVRLGDAVRLAGMGFRTQLAGGLQLSLTPGQALAAQGEVQLVDGRYQAYGQDLQINPGRLLFVGPLTNPGLAVRAERSVGSTTVGLNISGTLLHPKTAVFSSPSLPESEALSLLITGRSLDSASMSDGSAIKNAAIGLGIAQGDSVLRDLGARFGFSGLGLDTTGGLDGTRLSLGKQLNDRLFVRYAIGVLTGVGELITRYRLSRLFSIELTTSPEGSGGDLIYQIK
ncbi:translocation/assembly module TamB domain-containing protein [Halothiobacillus sp. DCM-1]|uniref:translocation/assembly module TamB domain-containing protein n=1 Tax=Halothiobacillus sp. DCM-1 TaxID=3112558 RepID=UPI0032494368